MSGLVAKFDSPEALVRALKRLRSEGYGRLDAYTPYPVSDVTRMLGGRTSSIGWIAVLSALAGAAITYGVIYWTAIADYPLNIGGRPLNSWPAFLPAILVVAALWSGLATLIGMLWLSGLPRWHHPLFDIHQFDRATYDKFFLLVEARPDVPEAETRALLESFGPEHVDRMET